MLNKLIDFDIQNEISKLEDDWIPQRIAKTEDYLLVSAYDLVLASENFMIGYDLHSHKVKTDKIQLELKS